MTRVLPTPQFASVVYGLRGVALDDPAEAYHEASRLYPRVGPERPEVLHELATGSEFVRAIERAGRTHDHRPAVALPAPAPLAGCLDDVLARRRSSTAEVMRPIALDELAALLVGSYAVLPRPGKSPRRPVPSGGALYPLELYVAAAGVRGLEPGLYHFQPFRRCLSLLAPLDWSRFRTAFVEPAPLDTAAALLVVSAVFWRSRIKYGPRGYRFALLEAGHLGQTVQLIATDLGLPALPVGGFFDRRLDELLGADGLDEAAVYAVAVGGSL
jgi:SagB-type dehydrogenase family enzyme